MGGSDSVQVFGRTQTVLCRCREDFLTRCGSVSQASLLETISGQKERSWGVAVPEEGTGLTKNDQRRWWKQRSGARHAASVDTSVTQMSGDSKNDHVNMSSRCAISYILSVSTDSACGERRHQARATEVTADELAAGRLGVAKYKYSGIFTYIVCTNLIS